MDRLFAAGIRPAALEFMPREALTALARVGRVPWPDQADTALLLRLDGSAEGLPAEMRGLRRLMEDAGPLFLQESASPAEEEALWDLVQAVNTIGSTEGIKAAVAVRKQLKAMGIPDAWTDVVIRSVCAGTMKAFTENDLGGFALELVKKLESGD